VVVQDYLRKKLLSAGFHVPEEGALQRTHVGGEGLETAAASVTSRAATAAVPAAATCNAAPVTPPVPWHAENQWSPDQKVSPQDSSAATAAIQSSSEPASSGRVSKQDMLRYKAGLLSKHDLLLTIAKRRIASPGA
jgi:hypothetical protein